MLDNLWSLSNIMSMIAMMLSFYSIIYARKQVEYTRKQFEADFFPRISLQVLERACGERGLRTCLNFRLKNQSNDRTVTNLKLEASLSHPYWKWRFWTLKWFHFYEKENLEIPPDLTRDTKSLAQSPQAQGLETFLLKSFPQLVFPESDPTTPEEVAFKMPVTFLLRVRLTYQPPIMNAQNIRHDFYYKLTPQFRQNNGNPYCLNFWDIKEIKR